MPLKRSTCLVLALLSGCGRSVVLPDASDASSSDSALDAPCRDPVRAVDLLFMVDDSNGTIAEQEALVAQFGRIVAGLTFGDSDRDAVQDFPMLSSLQIGVITSDMGVGGNVVFGCEPSDLGRDGLLRPEGALARPECDGEYPRFLQFVPESAPELVRDLECVASVGANGCGFEQPLEAMLKALAPSTARDIDGSPLRFFGDTRGHGDGLNAGFVRDEALLVLVVMTDEDDCSAADPALYDTESTRFGEVARRCSEHPEALHPIARYAQGFGSLKPDPRELVYAALVGIPPDLEGLGYRTLLADPRLEERFNPATGPNLVPSCNVPGMGAAFPPRRVLRVGEALEELGASTVATSLCTDDFTSAFDAILARVAQVVSGSCR